MNLMLSHMFGSGHPSGQGGSSDYIPNGQPALQLANPCQYNGYVLPGQPSPSPSLVGVGAVRSTNSVVGRVCAGNPGNRSGGENRVTNHHWYQPPQSPYNYVPPSNSREMRNKAEKQRRDRLNAFIAELATQVPLVSRSARRLDKTSILRLTATHLRIYQTLVKGKGVPQMELPPYVDQFVLEQLMCDQMGGFLLILSPTGKIIFISPTVEALLGHLQTDLMGQSLFTITASEDHDRLRTFLGTEGEASEWRKYFNIRIRRAGPKSETPQYESVLFRGVHRHLTPEGPTNDMTENISPISSSASTSSLQTSFNTDILVFFVKLSRPQPLVDRLVAVSKDEYVTRHLIDGRIIGCDQRISLIAGYMIEEIQGHSAFQYMHREDVRFVMIALRQMYDKGESKGNSCYRLKSRNGQFIYLKTFGFLEIDDQGIVESFVCFNVLVDEREGDFHINEMKRRYSAMFTSSLASLPYEASGSGNSKGSMTSSWITPGLTPVPMKTDRTEDPQALEVAINELMQNLPSPGSDESDSVTSPAHCPEPTPQCSTSGSLARPVSCKGAADTTASKHPHLRIKSTGKRAPSVSPDHVKRQRLTSIDSEPPQLSPPMKSAALPYPNEPPLLKIPKLEEQYQTSSSDMLRHQNTA